MLSWSRTLNATNPPDQVDQALRRLDLALNEVDTEQLDSVLAVLDQLTQLNQLLCNDQVPPEKFAETRSHVDQVLISIGALLNHLTQERDQVGAVLASLTPRLRRSELFRGSFPDRRLDVSN